VTVLMEAITERWRFDPPVDATTVTGKTVRIHILDRTISDHGVYLAFKGVPLTKTGKLNGVIDYRFLSDSEEIRLHLLVPPTE
jgi:hypothetical protein